VQWGYLLQLQQSSPRWAAAVAAYEAGCWDLLRQPFDLNTKWQHISSTPGGWEQVTQQYRAAVELCRVPAAEAPLPVICNNIGCENFAGVSEAAAACKKCARCSCRYCNRACQEADYQRHKAACRRMHGCCWPDVCVNRSGCSSCNQGMFVIWSVPALSLSDDA
jgi:hypothetical protein